MITPLLRIVPLANVSLRTTLPVFDLSWMPVVVVVPLLMPVAAVRFRSLIDVILPTPVLIEPVVLVALKVAPPGVVVLKLAICKLPELAIMVTLPVATVAALGSDTVPVIDD